MKRPVECILAIVCVMSLYRSFSGEVALLEIIGYVVMAVLSGLLIVVLHLRPNGVAEWIQPHDQPVEVRSAAQPLGVKK